MQLSPISTPDGRPMWSFGGERSFKTASHRGYVVSLEWVGEGKKAQACMCIWPETNVFVTGEGNGTWVIGRRAITEFVGFTPDGKCTGSASLHCYRECLEALPILGKERNDKSAFLSLVDCVVKFAPELALMPATPRSIRFDNSNPMWEMTVKDKNTGKVLRETEV
jgi:hypothetical protein